MKVKVVSVLESPVYKETVHFANVKVGDLFTCGFIQDGEWYSLGLNRYLKLTNGNCVDFSNDCLVSFDPERLCKIEEGYLCIPK